MSRHGHHRVRLVLSMTLSNAEAISHMAYGMLYRTYTLCHGVPCIAVRPYVHQWSASCAHCTELRTMHQRLHRRRKMKGRKRKDGWRGKSWRVSRNAQSHLPCCFREIKLRMRIYARTAGIQSARDSLLFPSTASIFPGG